MPTENNIRVQLAKNRITAKDLAAQLPDVDKVAMSYIEQGRVLPTKDTLNAMTAALNCKTADLYDLNDIDLTGKIDYVKEIRKSRIPAGDHGHDGMERIYIWCSPEEKEALFAVTEQLGYPSVAEWFRDKMRADFMRAIGLGGQALIDAAMCVKQLLPQATEIIQSMPTMAEIIQAIKDAPITVIPAAGKEDA